MPGETRLFQVAVLEATSVWSSTHRYNVRSVVNISAATQSPAWRDVSTWSRRKLLPPTTRRPFGKRRRKASPSWRCPMNQKIDTGSSCWRSGPLLRSSRSFARRSCWRCSGARRVRRPSDLRRPLAFGAHDPSQVYAASFTAHCQITSRRRAVFAPTESQRPHRAQRTLRCRPPTVAGTWLVVAATCLVAEIRSRRRRSGRPAGTAKCRVEGGAAPRRTCWSGHRNTGVHAGAHKTPEVPSSSRLNIRLRPACGSSCQHAANVFAGQRKVVLVPT